MERHSSRTYVAALSTALLVAIPNNVKTAQINYQLEASLLGSDNINLDSDSETSETVVIPRLRFDAIQEGARVRMQARGEMEYRHYTQNNFQDESRGEFAGQLNWTVLPERVSLVVEDYLSYQPIDIREGSSPGNLQQTNILVSGPSFIAAITERTKALVELRVAKTNAEVTEEFDGGRYSAAARLQHGFSETQSGSINLVSTKVEFDHDLGGADYRRDDGFVQYRRNGANATLTADAGHSRLRASGRDTESSALFRIDIDWRATAKSTLSGRLRYQLADSVQDLITRHGDLDEPMIPQLAQSAILVNSDVYQQRRVEFDYRFRGERVIARLRPAYQKARYISDALDDQNIRDGYIEFGYRVRPLIVVSARASARDRNYIVQQRRDRDRVYGLGFEQRLNRHWSWEAEILRNTRDSTAIGRDYEENSIGLAVIWRR